MIENSKNFDFSVVIPIYNVEEYLEESILSIINQTYSFKKHIQIILVNDGSPDNSEEICLKYQKLYPENIIYVKQENSGVSAARNNGLQYAEGKYINFLDSDDTWEPDAFEKIIDFAKTNPDVDIFCCKMRFFEASTRFHNLSYKFTENRIIDIQDEEECHSVHLHVTSSIFKLDTAKCIRFEENMVLGEDALYLNTLILKSGKYGAISDAQNNYRKRIVQSSAIQTKEANRRFYSETIEKFYNRLIKESIDIYGEVIPYIQSLLVYDIGWRVQNSQPQILSAKEYDEYCEELSKVLTYVDDEFILLHPVHKSFFIKSAMLRLKHKEDTIYSKFRYDEEKKNLCLGDSVMMKVPKNPNHCEVFSVEHINNEIIIYGLIKSWIIDADCTTNFVIAFAGDEYPVDLKIFSHNYETTMFGKNYGYYQFSVRIPFDKAFKEKKVRWIQPRLYFGDIKSNIAMHCGGRRMYNIAQCPAAYNIMDSYYFIPAKKGIKFVKPNDIDKAQKKLEKSFNKWVFKHNKKAAVMRGLYQIARRFKKKPLWIISDRMDVANDNGEVFYRYLCEKNPNDIDFEFVINKNSPDAARIKSIGKTVYFGSLKYKLHFLLANKIISSQANEENINAFAYNNYKYFYNLCDFEFVFLQHGIIKDDLSDWLNKRNKKIDLFITSAKAEQDSIVNGDYELNKRIVKLTGLPRFDRLYNLKDNEEKQILIMPTWRRSFNLLYKNVDSEESRIAFMQTEYFNFYNKLINDERLLSVMKKYGCTGKFCLHPLHSTKTDCFDENEVFSVAKGSINYQELFTKGALMVTDYSSTFFDFCYLNKPVVYTQFDRKDFYEGSMYSEGYFKYERDGFGPVCTTYNETVDKIIKSIENDFKIDSVYEERIKNFYAYNDNHNCERIYNAICDMDDNK